MSSQNSANYLFLSQSARVIVFTLLLLECHWTWSRYYERGPYVQIWTTPALKERVPWCCISQVEPATATIIANTNHMATAASDMYIVSLFVLMQACTIILWCPEHINFHSGAELGATFHCMPCCYKRQSCQHKHGPSSTHSQGVISGRSTSNLLYHSQR